jgi:hypothetical protein
VLDHANVMPDLLSVPRQERSAFLMRHWPNGFPLSSIKSARVADPDRNSPGFLLDGLWLQLGQALSSGASIRKCLQCGSWFPAGHGSGRREDAKFCSDEHRILFNSLKRKQQLKRRIHA